MELIILIAILLSSTFFICLGINLGKKHTSLADMFPIVFGRNAKIIATEEFSTSTVAATVSLATIILAYFELAGYFGLYLLFTAITTTIGMILVAFVSNRIWSKLSVYNHRPTMHEFLGVEFNSKTVSIVASICTSIGFLLIYATELIVGSTFLAKLIPSIPEWVTVIFLSAVGLIYTSFGGFRAVIKTDQWQMKFIWGMILILFAYYCYYVFSTGGIQHNIAKVPTGILNLSYRNGLGIFLIGLALMNIPTHISNMGIWQRISSIQEKKVLLQGLFRTTFSIFFTWGLLSLLACFAYMIVQPINSQNLLSDLLLFISRTGWGKLVLFFVILGLYGAMLSTASTNLIVVAQTISEDIIAPIKRIKLSERIDSSEEFIKSRIILTTAAIAAIFVVAGLKALQFSIADLVFAIYGGSLALFPPIIFSLYFDRQRLNPLSSYANIAVILGFIVGWGIAIYGKLSGNGNLIFLAPTFSIAVSLFILATGIVLNKSFKNLNNEEP